MLRNLKGLWHILRYFSANLVKLIQTVSYGNSIPYLRRQTFSPIHCAGEVHNVLGENGNENIRLISEFRKSKNSKFQKYQIHTPEVGFGKSVYVFMEYQPLGAFLSLSLL